MPIPTHSDPRDRDFPKPFRSACIGALLGLGAWAGLQACKSVEIDAPDGETTPTTTDSVTVSVTNQIDQDPNTITLILFPGNAIDIVNANVAKRLSQVGYKASVAMKLPVGTWKLAYEDRGGALFPMQDINSPAGEWLKSIFVKGEAYSLILGSDGNQTTWTPTFTTDPAIQ